MKKYAMGLFTVLMAVSLHSAPLMAADPMKDKEATPSIKERLTKDAVAVMDMISQMATRASLVEPTPDDRSRHGFSMPGTCSPAEWCRDWMRWIRGHPSAQVR